MTSSATERPPFWPRPNRFLDAIRGAGPPPTFMWLTLESPLVAEMVGTLGVDAAVIDLEHTAADLGTVRSIVVASQASGMTALVRVPSPDETLVGRVLDLGAEGVVFPRVRSVEQARTAASTVRYPPSGVRGWAGAHSRHVRWTGTTVGGDQDPRLLSSEFVRAADESVATIFMIEDEAGVEEAGAILDAGTPDGVIFGWADFAVSVAFDDAKVQAAKARVHEACRARSIGVAITSAADDRVGYFPGCFYSVGVDATILSSAVARRLAVVRSPIDAPVRTEGMPRPEARPANG